VARQQGIEAVVRGGIVGNHGRLRDAFRAPSDGAAPPWTSGLRLRRAGLLDRGIGMDGKRS